MKANRRTFLKFLGFSTIAPKLAIDVLSKVKPNPKNPLYSGKLGQYKNVVLWDRTCKVWADELWRQSLQPSYFAKFIK